MQKAKVKFIFAKTISKIISSFVFGKKRRHILRHNVINYFYKLTPIKNRDEIFNKNVKKLNFKNILDYSKFKIISLGEDCFVRTILQNYDLILSPKYDKFNGEAGAGSFVFDLVATSQEVLEKSLKNNFSDYLDDLKFVETEILGEKCKLWKNDKLNFFFNHDSDCPGNKEGKTLLIDRYKKRIDRFNNIIKNTDKILFFIRKSSYKSNIDDSLRILEILNKLVSKNVKFFYIALNMANDIELTEKNLPENMFIINLPYPTVKYNEWFTKDIRSTKEILEYEYKINKIIGNIILKNIDK